MQTLPACEAKYQFGRMIDTARAEPMIIEKHGHPVVAVVAIEEDERLRSIESGKANLIGGVYGNERGADVGKHKEYR